MLFATSYSATHAVTMLEYGPMVHSKAAQYWPIILAAIVSGFIIFLREPNIFLHAQFWGEDGKYWYGQAYNHGPLLTLFWPYAGSLQFMMRLTGSLSTFLPFTIVPLFFAAIAAVVQALPAVLMVTKRFRQPFGSLKTSLLVAAFYLLIPNSFEVHANLTNVNWHLALLALMVIVVPRTSKQWRYFDYPVLVISGLTGPFAVFLLPIAYYFWKIKKTDLSYVRILVAIILVQAAAYLLSHGGSRISRALDANPMTLLSIVGGRIATALFVGMNSASNLIATHHHAFSALGAWTIIFLGYVLWKAPLQLKAFVVFSWLTFLVALVKPQASLTMDQWPAILQGAGNRYFFLPMLSLFICIVWLAGSKTVLFKYAALASIAFIFCVGVVRDFTYVPRASKNFAISAHQFQRASKSQEVCLNVNPSPDWITCLRKH